MRFFVYYFAVSTCVFVVLMLATNFSSYWTVVDSWVHPDAYQHASDTIGQAVRSSKVTVYAEHDIADDTGSGMSASAKKILEIKYKKGFLDNSSSPSNPSSPSLGAPTALAASQNANTEDSPYAVANILPKTENFKDINIDISPYDNRILIPSIGKNVPIVDIDPQSGFDFSHLENIFMKELEKGVVHYPGTAVPGEKGNAFIFGHSSNYPWVHGDYNNVFALLDNVTYGDEIIVYYHQKKYTYIVRDKKIVKPGDVSSLARDPDAKELTLMTCWPIGTTLNRMLVFAELKE